jgi:hypothetical protein
VLHPALDRAMRMTHIMADPGQPTKCPDSMATWHCAMCSPLCFCHLLNIRLTGAVVPGWAAGCHLSDY